MAFTSVLALFSKSKDSHTLSSFPGYTVFPMEYLVLPTMFILIWEKKIKVKTRSSQNHARVRRIKLFGALESS